jgi:hypothetical protein
MDADVPRALRSSEAHRNVAPQAKKRARQENARLMNKVNRARAAGVPANSNAMLAPTRTRLTHRRRGRGSCAHFPFPRPPRHHGGQGDQGQGQQRATR